MLPQTLLVSCVHWQVISCSFVEAYLPGLFNAWSVSTGLACSGCGFEILVTTFCLYEGLATCTGFQGTLLNDGYELAMGTKALLGASLPAATPFSFHPDVVNLCSAITHLSGRM
jgi:hypothetical protein